MYLNLEVQNFDFEPIMLKGSEQWKSERSAFLRDKHKL